MCIGCSPARWSHPGGGGAVRVSLSSLGSFLPRAPAKRWEAGE